jgi:hypothetical protein
MKAGKITTEDIKSHDALINALILLYIFYQYLMKGITRTLLLQKFFLAFLFDQDPTITDCYFNQMPINRKMAQVFILEPLLIAGLSRTYVRDQGIYNHKRKFKNIL